MSKEPLCIPLRKSRYACLLLLIVHGGGLVVVWGADVPVWSKSLVSLGLAAGGLYSIAAHALRRVTRSINMLHCDANDNWQIESRSGQIHQAALLPGVYVHPVISVLRFRRTDGALILVLVLPDALECDDFRRLRARVRTTG